nr:LCP family protein [Selenomonas sp. F0473]
MFWTVSKIRTFAWNARFCYTEMKFLTVGEAKCSVGKITDKTVSDTQEKKDRTFIKYAGAVFAFSFVLVYAFYYIGGYYLSGSLRDMTGFHQDNEQELAYVLLMGVDRREGDIGRSDTLMLAAIDEEKGRASLLSIPRDTRTRVGNYGYDKINHAYAYGGHKLTLSSVSALLDVPVAHYILIDTSAFERIVDAVGGVDIDVEKRMHYEDPWDDNGGLVIDLYPGEQHMDGAHAIQYVRYRDGEGDIGRIARQQKFMRAFFAQLISPQVLPRLSSVIDELTRAVETDLSARQIITLIKRFKDVEANGLTMQTVIGTPAYLGDISYWIPDIVETRKALFEGVGVDYPAALLAQAEHDDAAYKADMPERLRKMMEESPEKETLPSSEELLAEGNREIEATRAAKKETMKEKPAEEKNQRERLSVSKEPAQDTPQDISVMVINSSGIDGAGAAVADILRGKGFRISSVETGQSSDRPKTAIMTAEKHVNMFYGMPFPCVIMPVDGAGEHQAIVIIGKDYGENTSKPKEGTEE